jgi:hypothetical protein
MQWYLIDQENKVSENQSFSYSESNLKIFTIFLPVPSTQGPYEYGTWKNYEGLMGDVEEKFRDSFLWRGLSSLPSPSPYSVLSLFSPTLLFSPLSLPLPVSSPLLFPPFLSSLSLPLSLSFFL